jgi:hypothetical protein
MITCENDVYKNDWLPKLGEVYYTFNADDEIVWPTIWRDRDSDMRCFIDRRAFKTRLEAKEAMFEQLEVRVREPKRRG